MSKAAERWIADHTGLTLLLVGAALIGVGGFAVDAEAVATAMVGIGALAMVLAVLLSRMEGAFKVGPTGLEGQLSTSVGLEKALTVVEEKSEARDLNPDERADAVADVVRSLLAEARSREGGAFQRLLGAPSPAATPPDYDALAENAIESATAMVDISTEDVPSEALGVIRESAGLDQAPVVEYARRRPGRGAPRWHLWTDAGEWRVSNTRHGWSGRQIE